MTINEIEEYLLKTWKECQLKQEVKERGFAFAAPIKADLLITGINPSWRDKP